MAVDAVAEIKARLDIVEVIGGYVTLQRSGREFKGLCPFHAEKTPSFSVSQDPQAWYCFGCQEGGDLIKFVERIERIDFRQALELLADRAGVELEQAQGPAKGAGRRRRRALELNQRAQAYYEHVLWASDAGAVGRELLADRGVAEPLARRFGVGFAPAGGGAGDALARYLTTRASATLDDIVSAGLAHPAQGGIARDRFRNRLIFPIRDERGAVLGFGGRALGDGMPKYLNTTETAAYHKSAALFGIDLARDAVAREHTVLVVEGYFDVIAAHAAGIANTVASSGTALTREQVKALKRHATSVTLCFDSDDAGRAARSRAVDVIAAEGLQARICLLPAGSKDPDELVRRDPTAFAAAVAAAAPEWQVLLDGAIGEGEGGSIEARRGAAERAVAVLARIPEAATREMYLQQAARRLDIGARSLATDLSRAVHDGARRPGRIVAAPPPVAPVATIDDTPEAAAVGSPMPQWEAYIASIVVQRPELAPTFLGTLGLDLRELSHPIVRRVTEVAAGAADGAFPLHRLSTGDQRQAAMLMVRDVPELAEGADPAALRRAMADCVRDVHEASVIDSMVAIRHEMRRAKEEGRDEELHVLATRMSELAAEAPHLRRTLSAT